MTENQTKTANLINDFRRACRREKRTFTTQDFLKAMAFGGLSVSYLKRVLRALVARNYVEKEGNTTSVKYTWKPIYKDEAKLEEYDAINLNSMDIVYKKATDYVKTVKPRVKAEVAEPILTVAKAIEFLKANCPNICITEKLICYDGSIVTKEY